MRKKFVAVPLLALALAFTGCNAAPNSGESGGVQGFDPLDLKTTTDPGTSPVDVVNWGVVGGEPNTIDPARAGNDPDYIAVANMCDTLMRTTPEFGVEAGLAEAIDWNDELTAVITVRDGVTFWDGSALTAEDVAYSLSRMSDPVSQSVNTGAFSSVESIEASGPLEVTVTFSQHDAQFVNALAGPAGYVFQEAFTTSVGEEKIGTPTGGIMCTGPFAFTEWNAGDSIVLTANENYWDGVPLVSELRLEFVSDDTALSNGLISGELDGAFNIPISAVSQLSSSDAGSMNFGPSTATMSLSPTRADGPGANVKIRQALSQAIDRESFIKATVGGYGSNVKTMVVPFLWEGSENAPIYREGYDALPELTYDVEAARAIVEASDPVERTLKLATIAGETQVDQAATIIQSAAEEIGLTVEVDKMPGTEFGTLFYEESVRADYDLVFTTGYVDSPGVLLYPEYFAMPEGLFNWTKYDNAEVATELTEARRDADPASAAESFVAAQAVFAPEMLQITLGQEYTRMYLSNELSGATVSFSYITTPWALRLGGK